MRRCGRLLAGGVLLLLAAGCLPVSAPGNTSKIAFVSTATVGGWKYDYYRNTAYPCAISGYQTFVIGTKVGSSDTAARPLWTFMHGGGVGWFAPDGTPQPSAGQKKEEAAASLIQRLTAGGLVADVRTDAAGFRMVAVSYCSHDIYSGVNNNDPHNPNLTPEGTPRLTNGTLATKAAIAYAQQEYPTTKTFLHGGSAGSVGTFSVAWSMQREGRPLAGFVADASIVNQEALAAAFSQGVCTDDTDPTRSAAVAARVHPDLANIDNEVDKLVASGRLTVPVMHVWNHGDVNTCGAEPMDCPMRDGTQVTMGITDCLHEPLRLAIAAQGATSRSRNMPLCVDSDAVPDCSVHVTTPKNGLVNTDPQSPADYIGAIVDWMHARLADA